MCGSLGAKHRDVWLLGVAQWYPVGSLFGRASSRFPSRSNHPLKGGPSLEYGCLATLRCSSQCSREGPAVAKGGAAPHGLVRSHRQAVPELNHIQLCFLVAQWHPLPSFCWGGSLVKATNPKKGALITICQLGYQGPQLLREGRGMATGS